MSVVTAHMVYFCAFTRSGIFPKHARKLGVGRGQFDAGVNGLNPVYVAARSLRSLRSNYEGIFIDIKKCTVFRI